MPKKESRSPRASSPKKESRSPKASSPKKESRSPKASIKASEKTLPKNEEIVLYEHQIPHVETLEDILAENYCAFDMSIMGSGKTYTTSMLALNLEFKHVIVVCPASLESKWKSMKKYGVPLENVISYQSLRSRKGSVPRHGLLNRHDILANDEIAVFFTPTDRYNKMIDEGCLLVFDEVQNFKNKNDQFMACQALTSSILKSGGISRYILLSGTPIDKEKHALNMMQMMGIIRSHKMYIFNQEERKLKLIGAQELIDFAKVIDPPGTINFLKYHPFTKDNMEHNAYLMFQKVIKPKISASMPPPKLPVKINSMNGYYKIEDEEDKKGLIKGIINLQTSLMYNDETKAVNFASGFSKITSALSDIEKYKVGSMIRVAKQQLEDDPNCKVVLFYNFRASIFRSEEELKDFNPLVLHGETVKTQRQKVVDKFNQDNDKYRVLICNMVVGSTGIDLDDKYGNRPRYAFINPNYRVLELHQVVYRFFRSDTVGPSYVKFFYGIVAQKETSLLNSLSRKSHIMKDTTGEFDDVKYPGDLESYFEK